MSTGLDSFSNPAEIGPLYPFPGTEVLLVIVGFVLWLAWHVLQTRAESKEYEEALEHYDQVGVDAVAGSPEVPGTRASAGVTEETRESVPPEGDGHTTTARKPGTA